jgi:ADP-ribosylglycohydrolase
MVNKLESQKSEKNDFMLCCSSVLGAFLGDAMGSYAEFSQKDPQNQEYVWQNENYIWGTGKGQVTDDSEMALSMAFGLLDSNKGIRELNNDILCFFYSLWAHSHPFDIGSTTRNAMNAIDRAYSKNVEISHPTLKFSEGLYKRSIENNSNSVSSLSNGFIMRNTPLVVWFYLTKKEIIKDCFQSKQEDKFICLYVMIYNIFEKDVSITHQNIEASQAASLYGFMIINIFYYKQNYPEWKTKEIARQTLKNFKLLLVQKSELKCFEDFVSEVEKYKNLKKILENYDMNYKMGWYKHGFIFCLAVLIYFEKIEEKYGDNIYEQIMFDLCNLGGDTDTNCAIVGGLLGPLVGFEKLPDKYKDLVKFVPKGENCQVRNVMFSPGLIAFYVEKIIELLASEEKIEENK